MEKEYNSSSIKVLSGLDPVKTRPGMYTVTANPNHMVTEVLDNSLDEALAGFAKTVKVTCTQKMNIIIEDDGRGIPVDIHEEEGVPAVQLVFTTLHSGGKFSNDSYDVSGGLHGVGISVTNALSSRLNVEVRREGKIHKITFSDGYVTAPLKVIGKCGKSETGTKVSIEPNPIYFDEPHVNLAAFKKLLQEKAFLKAGVRITFRDESEPDNVTDEEYYYVDGIKTYLDEKLNPDFNIVPSFYGSRFVEEDTLNSTKGEGLEFAICWNEEKSFKKSFVNLIPTPDDGTHVSGFRTGVFEALKSFMSMYNLNHKTLKVTAEDLLSSATVVISTTVSSPEFQGQTKDKLNNRYVATLMASLVKDGFEKWLNSNIQSGKLLVEMALEQAKIRDKTSQKSERKKLGGVTRLPAKLTDCNSDNPEICELFIVEGDSAGGSAKQGRLKETQAIITLKGKPLNTWEAKLSKIVSNEEINALSIAIGIPIHTLDEELDWSALRYHFVGILTDADKDGFHIQVLLAMLYLKYFPQLVLRGHVKVVQPPLYRMDITYKNKRKKSDRNKTFYVLDEQERAKLEKKLIKEGVSLESDVSVMRFKGLGEMDPEQLRESSMHPDTRIVKTLTIKDMDLAMSSMDMLASKKRASDREAWIRSSGAFEGAEYNE